MTGQDLNYDWSQSVELNLEFFWTSIVIKFVIWYA